MTQCKNKNYFQKGEAHITLFAIKASRRAYEWGSKYEYKRHDRSRVWPGTAASAGSFGARRLEDFARDDGEMSLLVDVSFSS